MEARHSNKIVGIALCLTFLLTPSACKKALQERSPMPPPTPPTAPQAFQEPRSPRPDVEKFNRAVIQTSKGKIAVELFPKEAPLSVTNFVQLSQGGFYNGLTFHRVEPGFVIQGGDPTATGTGGPGYTIPAEIEGNPHKHVAGALAWARTGDQVNPERRSSGSQFYITLSPTPFLDRQYTVFGRAVEGMEVVGSIVPGDKILSIEVP